MGKASRKGVVALLLLLSFSSQLLSSRDLVAATPTQLRWGERLLNETEGGTGRTSCSQRTPYHVLQDGNHAMTCDVMALYNAGDAECHVVQAASPEANGCGVEVFTLPSDNPFHPVCNFHDLCYGRCTDPTPPEAGDGSSATAFRQKDCDDMFFRLMLEVVEVKKYEDKTASLENAERMYDVVRTGAGSYSFREAVEESCSCVNDPPSSSTNRSSTSPTWYAWLEDDMEFNPEPYEAIGNVTDTLTKLMYNETFFEEYRREAEWYSCERDTGGTCSFSPCDPERNAYCDRNGADECLCHVDQCAIDGKCVNITTLHPN